MLIPGYLDRLQIVTRDANDEVAVAMYDRWAEPLENGIAQVLADNLGAHVGSVEEVLIERVTGSRSFRGAAESRECSIIRWSSWYCASRAGPGGRRPWTRLALTRCPGQRNLLTWLGIAKVGGAVT